MIAVYPCEGGGGGGEGARGVSPGLLWCKGGRVAESRTAILMLALHTFPHLKWDNYLKTELQTKLAEAKN